MEDSGFLELPELSVGAARGTQQSQIQPEGVSVHGGGKLDPRSLILLTFFTNIIAINSSATWLILLCIITTALFSLCALPWRFFMGWAGFELLCVICAFVPPMITPQPRGCCRGSISILVHEVQYHRGIRHYVFYCHHPAPGIGCSYPLACSRIYLRADYGHVQVFPHSSR